MNKTFKVEGPLGLIKAFYNEVGEKKLGGFNHAVDCISVHGKVTIVTFYPGYPGTFRYTSKEVTNDKDYQYTFILPSQWDEALEHVASFNNIKIGTWIQSKTNPQHWGKVTNIDHPNQPSIHSIFNGRNWWITDGYNILDSIKLLEFFTKEAKRRGYVEGATFHAWNSSRGWISDITTTKTIIKGNYKFWSNQLSEFNFTHEGSGLIYADVDGAGWAKLSDPKDDVSFDTYINEYRDGKLHFGCQSFTKEDLQIVQRLLSDPINAKITIRGKEVTQDIITKLQGNLS